MLLNYEDVPRIPFNKHVSKAQESAYLLHVFPHHIQSKKIFSHELLEWASKSIMLNDKNLQII